MPKVIMSSQEYGGEEFLCETIEEAGDMIRRLAMKAYEEIISGDGVERLFTIVPDEQVELSA